MLMVTQSRTTMRAYEHVRRTGALASRGDSEASWALAHVSEGMCGFLELRRRGLPEGDDLHLASLVHVEVLDQGDEVTVTGRQHDRIELGRELHGVYRETDVPIGLLRPVSEYLEVFDLSLDAYLGERVEEVLLFAAFRLDDIGDGPHEGAPAYGLFEDGAEVDARFIEVLGAVVEILGIDKDAYPLRRVFDNSHTK